MACIFHSMLDFIYRRLGRHKYTHTHTHQHSYPYTEKTRTQIDVNRQGKHDQTFISCSHAFKDTNVHISSAL